jgi:hypothetical protein
MAKEVECWECAHGDSCFKFHRTKEEAQACSPVEPYTVYACEKCGELHFLEDIADACCDLESAEQHVTDMQQKVEREKNPKKRKLYSLALKTAKHHVETIKERLSKCEDR